MFVMLWDFIIQYVKEMTETVKSWLCDEVIIIKTMLKWLKGINYKLLLLSVKKMKDALIKDYISLLQVTFP